MNTPCIIGIALGLMTTALHAGPRTSTDYSLVTDTADAGGKRGTSASYTNDGSAGGIAGLSTVAAPAETARHGYIGQLYEVTALQLAAAPTTVNEGGTRQLSAAQLLDDATTINVSANSIAWSVQSGPLSIDANGLATAATVYENSAATAQGSLGGNTGTLGLTIFDTIPDNFGSYAGDGIGDDWQVQFFGQNNPNAGPAVDADLDGHNNLFEFTAGLVPTDALSVFNWRIEPVVGQPAQKKVIFSPIVAGRSYTVVTSPTIGTGASWGNLVGGTVGDNGNERTVTDLNATENKKFYKVEIVKP